MNYNSASLRSSQLWKRPLGMLQAYLSNTVSEGKE